jgi:hypothetical protein
MSKDTTPPRAGDLRGVTWSALANGEAPPILVDIVGRRPRILIGAEESFGPELAPGKVYRITYSISSGWSVTEVEGSGSEDDLAIDAEDPTCEGVEQAARELLEQVSRLLAEISGSITDLAVALGAMAEAREDSEADVPCNPAMNHRAALAGLAHWWCIDPATRTWRRADGMEVQLEWGHNAGNWMGDLRRIDLAHPIWEAVKP